ncbi:MAG: hypothetical protein H8E79_07105 [Desulfobulbaceae bacterium]|uniref:Aminoglycoside phosphotransferase domain-containing protein n=1 Tax=Candidatus Desulfatifera sulfidica TaxID=2841691 RepID=A0A8J6NAQ5_9BACT|nr:hypothetical protein [Candidatus Desulfatifera sulfidica]
MSAEQLPEYIQFLLTPEAYPHAVDKVELIQTHISFVTVAGDFVYKWKKPVNFGFLDFSTLEKRQECCERELFLNRRLCPDIYLGTVAVAQVDGHLMLNGPGEVLEYGVKMARMPEERMMSRVIAAGGLGEADIDRIIERLVPFYEQVDGSDAIREFGHARSVAVNVLENFDQTEGFVGQGALSRNQFQEISDYAREFLTNEDLFEQRIVAGRIRDCHGDLYSANICLADQVQIFDCIEFNDRFRYADVAADVAFLAMDLDFHGLDDLSQLFIDQFVTRSADDGLLAMLNFYKCYRAYVRGKIGLFTAADSAVDAGVREDCQAQAGRYFKLAHGYALAG